MGKRGFGMAKRSFLTGVEMHLNSIKMGVFPLK
jgi:hypothetical protein